MATTKLQSFAYGFDQAYDGDLGTWQSALRAKFLEALDFGNTPHDGFRVVEATVKESGGLRETRYLVEPAPWAPQPIYEIAPAGRPNGITLLAFHGHGSPERMLRDGMYYYIWELARRGYRVILPILFGKQEREERNMPYADARDAMAVCASWSVEADALGVSLLGVRLFDTMLAFQLAKTLPDVDSTRIGSVGLSMGGELAIYLPAILPEIQCTVSAGFLCSFHSGLIRLRTFCQCYSIRGWPQMFDMPDIAGCVAPRPMQVQKGLDDGCIDPVDAAEAFAKVQRIYQAAGAEENVGYVTYPGGHSLNVDEAEKWFRTHMSHDS